MRACRAGKVQPVLIAGQCFPGGMTVPGAPSTGWMAA